MSPTRDSAGARLLAVDTEDPEPRALQEAVGVLRRGGLVAFPTETVYGLGANALDESAVGRLFVAKGRPAYNPVIVHVPDVASARTLAREWPAPAERLAAAFWPGPLTLVVPKAAVVPDVVTAGLGCVALRVPAHPVALALLRTAAIPLAAPSANSSGELSPTTAAHVLKGLGSRVDLILDAGPTTIGIESTVIDLCGPHPTLLRPGLLSEPEIEAVVGPLGVTGEGGPAPEGDTGEAPRRSPGMLARHYAPRAAVMLAESAEALGRALEDSRRRGERIGAVLRRLPESEPAFDHVIRLPDDPAGYAHGLYSALHALDELGCGRVVVEQLPDDPGWAGVRDRLGRAAHPRPAG